MASGPITLWRIDGETVETVSDFIFGGSKITVDGDCSHEIKSAQDDKAAQKLYADAELEKVPLKSDCAKWLFSLLDDLSKLKISTYDSFFNDILRCFAFDMGLDAGINILEGTAEKRMLEKALDDLLLDYHGRGRTKEFYAKFATLNERRELRRVGQEILGILGGLKDEYFSVPEEAVGNIAFRDTERPQIVLQLATSNSKKVSVAKTLSSDLELALTYKKDIQENSQISFHKLQLKDHYLSQSKNYT